MVKLTLSLENGWKEKENGRYGQVLVIKFMDNNNNVLFTYAPKLNEAEFWKSAFDILIEYDKMLKKIKSFDIEKEKEVCKQ